MSWKPVKKPKKLSNPYAHSLRKVSIERVDNIVVARILNESGQPTSAYVEYDACIKYELLLPEDMEKLKKEQNKIDNTPF